MLVMKRKMFSAITLTLLLTSLLTLAFNIQPVKASGTVYIRADGSIDPSTANITSMDNVTYTFTGNISDFIVVERDNIVVDGAGYTVQGTGSGTGIALSERSNVTIKNMTIKAFHYGIWLDASSNYNSISGNNIIANNGYGIMLFSSSGNSISGNNITNNVYGIDLYSSSGNSISGNNIIANNGYGIWLEYSSNYNSIYGNNITNNECGISLGFSSINNSIYGNNITNNECGISLSYSSYNSVVENVFTGCGLLVFDSYENRVEGNTVNGKPLVYLEGVSDYTVEDAGQVVLVNCNSIRVENLNLSKATVGVLLLKTTNSTIANNEAGMVLAYSSNNTILGNNITNNVYGIDLYSSSGNSISGNNITNNECGISLSYSSNNTISGNNITANNGYGIMLFSSSGNSIFHNNFINNTNQVNSYNSVNTWDDGYPSGGNYWSDYVGVDVKSGSSQDLPSSDGIGDTPYIIDASNRDRYPLIIPYGAPPPPTYALTITATVGGTTNPACGTYSYTANSLVQVTAIPNTDYLFDHWELDSVNVGSANPYTVLMDKDHALKIVFSPIPPPKPVGGYSFQIEGYTTTQPITPYLTLIAILTIGFTTIRRKTKKKNKINIPSRTNSSFIFKF
jgi:parallel beta-helix repeat protein